MTKTCFFGLLQTFWGSWGLRSVEAWTFPAMLLMLASPTLLLTIIVGTLFRPIAFGMPLFIPDNASSVPMMLICVLLGTTRNRLVHYILVPLITILIILDTLFINYMIR